MSNYSTIMGFGVYGYAVINLFQAAKRQLAMFKQFLHRPGSISQTRPGPSFSRGRREEQRVSVHEKETRQDMFPSPGHRHTQPSKRPDLRTDISARMPKKKQPWWLWPHGLPPWGGDGVTQIHHILWCIGVRSTPAGFPPNLHSIWISLENGTCFFLWGWPVGMLFQAINPSYIR